LTFAAGGTPAAGLAHLVLESTKEKPAAKNEVTIKRAEDFLKGLAKEAIACPPTCDLV
jgi:hypothetical protein